MKGCGSFRRVAALAVLLAGMGGCSRSPQYPDGVHAVMVTPRGTIVLQLEYEAAPLTVTNFAGLATGQLRNSQFSPGTPYYNGLTFHRVEPGFVIQGGDPLGNGTGDPGYRFPDEFNPDLRHDRAGILSMANSGPDTNGSQFFITLGKQPHLDGRHTVFGHVIRGLDVLERILPGDRIERIEIVRQGAKAKNFSSAQVEFDRLLQKASIESQQRELARQRAARDEITRRWPNLVSTASGLMYDVLRRGAGSRPETGSRVRVHYSGTLLSGKLFDSSYERNEPISFTLGKGEVIRGWDEAVADMRPGERRLLVIPPELGYGNRPMGSVIPAHSYLVFEVELVDID